jgi:23S rRNA (cytosine1962-C5)-methyltransferase
MPILGLRVRLGHVVLVGPHGGIGMGLIAAGQMRPSKAIRLKPKAEARAIRHGFPWVYADELVTDRRTQAPGARHAGVLEDPERKPLGLVTVNPKSKIIARMLDRDPEAEIDQDWLRPGCPGAGDARGCIDAPFYRLVHAEADGLPGVIIDRFGDTAVIQPNAAWADTMAPLAQALQGDRRHHVVKNGTGPGARP